MVITEGVAYAPAVVFYSEPVTVSKVKIEPSLIDKELEYYYSARERTQNLLEHEISTTVSKVAKEFLEVTLLYLLDPYINQQIINKIKEELLGAESAIYFCYNEYINELINANDPFALHNEFEIRNLAESLILELRRKKITLPNITSDCILVCNNITPAQFLTLDTSHIKGVLIEYGNTNSHLAIVLRSTKIPTIFNVNNVTKLVQNGTQVLIDAYDNKIYLEPLDEIVWTVKRKADKYKTDDKKNIVPMIAQYRTAPDGQTMRVLANVGSLSELNRLTVSPSSGIGLFRTEFLFMQCTEEPDENTQYEVYKKIMTSLPNKYPVTFRTFDFSADKLPLYMSVNTIINVNCADSTNENSHSHQMMLTQLRALIRASVFGTMRIMFPMIAEYETVCNLVKMFKDTKQELINEGLTIGNIELGIMIETPAGAIMSNELAELVDFFSIGTNDLTQYTEACSREAATHRNDELTPAVLRLINFTVKNAVKKNIPVCICGELVHNLDYFNLFVALHIHDFSVAPFYLHKLLDVMHSNNFKDILDLDERINKVKNLEDIRQLNKDIKQIMQRR